MEEPTLRYEDEVEELKLVDPLAWDDVNVKKPLQSIEKDIIFIGPHGAWLSNDPAGTSNDCKHLIMDYTSEFTTHEVFKTKEGIGDWLREVGRCNGFVVVVKRSKLPDPTRRPIITYACERIGKYRSNQKHAEGDPEKKRRKRGTKKCECPFTLTARMETTYGWVLRVNCGVHNHPAALNLVGHSYAGRLNEREKNVLKKMTQNLALPRDILRELKSMDQNNLSTLRQIYNVRHQLRLLEMAGRSQMQHLLHNLFEFKYIEWHWTSGETNELLDIFWTHPFNIDLLRTFPTVLLMDVTYKTNKYKLPLFEIVGETSTGKTFMVACAYLNSKKNDNYHWVLDRLKTVMGDIEPPKVIVTDKEQALMTAVADIFPQPTTQHLLCRWHICENVEAEGKKVFMEAKNYEEFMELWGEIMSSDTEEKYKENLLELKERFGSWPQMVDYVLTSWLDPYKERFVDAWANQYMHLDNKTTNRVESQHAKLKRQLGSSQCNFALCFQNIHALLEANHNNILASFEKSMIVVQHEYKPEQFKELRGVISIHALDIVVKSCKHANRVSHHDDAKCTCSIRQTHGLPCDHEIARFQIEGRPIPLSCIHDIWKRLSVTPATKNEDVSFVPELQMLAKRVETSDATTRLHLLNKIKEIACPDTTYIIEPHVKQTNKGRPAKGKGKAKVDTSTKRDLSRFEYVTSGQLYPMPSDVFVREPSQGSQTNCKGKGRGSAKQKDLLGYLKSINTIMVPFIRELIDVNADGNCGFRSVAALMGFGEDQWVRVCKDLLKELQTYPRMYNDLFKQNGRVDEVAKMLDHYGPRTTRRHWFTFPEMGYLVASYYNCVLHIFGKYLSLTFLSLRTPPVDLNERKHLSMAHINGNHFVQLVLHDNYPFPPICSDWFNHCSDVALRWADPYQERIHSFKALVEPEGGTDEIITIDCD